MRELEIVGERSVLHEGEKLIYGSRNDKFIGLLLDSLRNFFKLFNTHQGNRTIEDQNAVDAALAALTDPQLRKEHGMTSRLHKAIGVTYKQISRASQVREDLEDMDKAHWIRAGPRQYLNNLNGRLSKKNGSTTRICQSLTFLNLRTDALSILVEVMHSDFFSVIDNTNKEDHMISVGLTPEGKQLYDMHPTRMLLFTPDEKLEKLTGVSRSMSDAPVKEPHPAWIEFQKVAGRPMKGSRKLLKRATKCKCLGKFHVNFCSCPICTAFEENLKLYHWKRSDWYKQAAERQTLATQSADHRHFRIEGSNASRPKPMYKCDMCENAICAERNLYRTMSSQPSTCMNILLCEKICIPQLSLPQLDINGDEKGEKDDLKIWKEECCSGSHKIRGSALASSSQSTTFVRACGWDAKLASCPEFTLEVEDVVSGVNTIQKMRGCPVEMTSDPMIWNAWVKVKRASKNESSEENDGTYGDNGVSTSDAWLPKRGTRMEFMFYLKQKFELYARHQWQVKFDRRARMREIFNYLVRPAIDSAAPIALKDVCYLQSDFSSVLHSLREHDATCSFPESHNCDVVCATFSPRAVAIETMSDTHPRTVKKMHKKGITRLIQRQNFTFYAMSKERGSAYYHQNVLEDTVSIIKYGKLSDSSTGEAFFMCKRLPGGRRIHGDVLPDGLSEWVGDPVPLGPDINVFHQRRDGCAAQFQGLHAFWGTQTFLARTGCNHVDKRNPPNHGKCCADGRTHSLKGYIQRSVNDDYGPGTQGLVRHLAAKNPSPKKIRSELRYTKGVYDGMFAGGDYIYIHVLPGRHVQCKRDCCCQGLRPKQQRLLLCITWR
jgi:hypothetical protein